MVAQSNDRSNLLFIEDCIRDSSETPNKSIVTKGTDRKRNPSSKNKAGDTDIPPDLG